MPWQLSKVNSTSQFSYTFPSPPHAIANRISSALLERFSFSGCAFGEFPLSFTLMPSLSGHLPRRPPLPAQLQHLQFAVG